MKKLLLLVATGIVMLPALAQQNTNSVVKINQLENPVKIGELENPSKAPANFMNRNAPGGVKKTTVNNPFWYSYADVLFQTSVSKFYYNVVYQDTNVTYQGTNGTTNVFMHGMGQSFDPTDSAFYWNSSAGQIQDYDFVNQDWKVTQTTGYTVDSIAFASKYYRTQNVTDSMIIYIAKVSTGTGAVNPTGILALGFAAPSTERFVTAWFDSITNGLNAPATAYTRMAIALDAAYYGDTTTNGFSNRTVNGIALPSPIVCTPGQKILAYVTFKSATAYPLGTPVTAANYMRMYSYDLPGAGASPIQNQNSHQSGLVATDQIKFQTPDYTYQGHSILIPSIAYTTDGFLTDMSFHVICPTCPLVTTGVKEANNPINEVKVYPNPSADQVAVSFNVNGTFEVNVTISNTIGQVLKSKNMGKVNSGKAIFATSDLTNGVYFYTVEANGHRSAGRFVISH